MDEITWFLVFWGCLAALCALEHALDDRRSRAVPGRRWSINIGAGIFNGLLFAALPVSTVAAAIWAEAQGIGALNALHAPLWLAVALIVAARSVGQYAFHRLAHSVPALWAVHRVHHSDKHLDATTALRFHPVEAIASAVFFACIVIAIGAPPWILAAFETIEILFGLLLHTSLALPPRLEKCLQPIVVTPRLHRLHHSDYEPETNSNYGATFIVWDRLFGTYCEASARPAAEFRPGLDTVSDKDASSIDWVLFGALNARGSVPTSAARKDS